MNFEDIAIEAAKACGEILRKRFTEALVAEGKGSHDLVSKVDYESEKKAIENIKAAFPEHTIIAEESGTEERQSEFAWYIDPLDGTSNFLTGNPYFSVSIALAENSEVILGVVYNPVLDELYLASKGKGATLNGKILNMNEGSELAEAIIASAYSAEEEKIKEGLMTIEKLALASRKVVINFSPALDLCNIARNKIDALVDNGTTPEDHAAGSLIVTESGGVVRNYRSTSFQVDEIGIIAGSQKLIDEISEKIIS